jgi:hypothetical protein
MGLPYSLESRLEKEVEFLKGKGERAGGAPEEARGGFCA